MYWHFSDHTCKVHPDLQLWCLVYRLRSVHCEQARSISYNLLVADWRYSTAAMRLQVTLTLQWSAQLATGLLHYSTSRASTVLWWQWRTRAWEWGWCSCCLYCVSLLWAEWNGLPPTPDTLYLGCSYYLHISHHFLSAWGVLRLEKKNCVPDLVQSSAFPAPFQRTLVLSAIFDRSTIWIQWRAKGGKGHGWPLLIKIPGVITNWFPYLNRWTALALLRGVPLIKSTFKAWSSCSKS